jgi:colanic acid/amylovoran biosynthesis protein
MNIVIVNAHWSNRGDEAAHRALWEELQKRYPGCRITVMFKDRQPVSWFPEMENTEYFSCQFKASSWDIWLTALTRGLFGKDPLLKKAVRTLKTANLIIYPPGGSVINDRFFWSKQMEYLVPFLCARLYRIPMFVAAPSIGPFEKPHRLRTWLLQTPKILCVREAISKKYLETIGIRGNVHVTMDLAFMNSVDAQVNQKTLETDYQDLCHFLGAHQKTVGMTISDFKWHVKHGKNPEMLQRIEESFRQLIDSLTTQGYGVLLIPQLFGNQNDEEYLKTFVKNEHTQVLSEKPDTYLQQHVISKLYAVVGMRYHCNIFAAKMGTPFIAVVYEEKMSGFLELAGLSDYSMLLEEVTFDRLVEKFQTLEKNHNQFRQGLVDNVKVWRANARKTVELLSENYSSESI